MLPRSTNVVIFARKFFTFYKSFKNPAKGRKNCQLKKRHR